MEFLTAMRRWRSARRLLLLVIALTLLAADILWIIRWSRANDTVTLTVGLGSGTMRFDGLRVIPVVDGPPLPDPQPVHQITLNPSGDGWIKDGQPIDAIGPLLRRDPALPTNFPIVPSLEYAVVDLGGQETYGRALEAMRLVMRQGICDATVLSKTSNSSVGTAAQLVPIFRLESFVDQDGAIHTCTTRKP